MNRKIKKIFSNKYKNIVLCALTWFLSGWRVISIYSKALSIRQKENKLPRWRYLRRRNVLIKNIQRVVDRDAQKKIGAFLKFFIIIKPLFRSKRFIKTSFTRLTTFLRCFLFKLKRGYFNQNKTNSKSQISLSKPKELIVIPLYFGWEIVIRKVGDLRQHIVGPFKKYWQYIVVVLALIITVSTILLFNPDTANPIKAATYNFIQTSWSGGASSTASALHPDDQTGWTYFFSSTNIAANTDLRVSSSTYYFTDDGATSTDSSIADKGGFAYGSKATTTIKGTGSGASIQLLPQPHINEYTIGALADISVVVSSVANNPSGGWIISFSNTPDLSRIFKNDKFTDSSLNAWKIISVSDSADKIVVIDSESNSPSIPVVGNGTVGRWFNSIAAWEAGRQGDLTVNGRNAIERGLPYYDGSPDTTAVTIDGWTTDADHYIEIYVPLSERHQGKWDNNKYRLESSHDPVIHILEGYVRIKGLQLRGISTGSAIDGISTGGAPAGDKYISDNIITATLSGLPWYADAICGHGADSGSNLYIWNNIIYGWNLAEHNASGIYAEGGSMYLYNNTLYNNGFGLYQRSTSDIMVAKNNLVASSTTGFSGTFDSSSDYNASSDSTSTGGANDKINQTFSFVSTSTDNFHLSFNDTAAKDAGADLSADSNLSFSTDIDGETRGTWDIGADEADEGARQFIATIRESGGDFSSLYDWEATMSANDDMDLTAATTKVFSYSIMVGSITASSTVVGATSGATGIAVFATATTSSSQILIKSISGTFQSGEQVQVDASNYVVISDNGNPVIAVAKIDGLWSNPDTASVIIDGWTTSATNYIKIYTTPEARHKGMWDDTKYRMQVADTAIRSKEDNIRVEGIQIYLTVGTYDKQGIDNYGAATADYRVSDNIIKGPSGSVDGDYTYGIRVCSTSGTARIWNNIVYDFTGSSTVSGGIGVCGSYTNSTVTSYAYNNTLYNNTNGVWLQGGGSPVNIFKNNISQNSTVGFSGNFDSSSDYNLSDDGTPPGANSISSTTVLFVATSTYDFHLSHKDVAAKDAGTNLSSDSNLSFAADIDSYSRSINTLNSAWDIGAHEWHSSFPIYYSFGVFESAAIDLGARADFDYLAWNPANQNSTTTARVQVAANNDNSTWNFIDLNQSAYPQGVTVVERLIREDCTGYSNCYTSLAAWEVAEQKDLVAANEIAVAKIDGPWSNPDTTAISIDGWTTDATHYIRIYTTAAARHNGVWDETKYRLETTNVGAAIAIKEGYVKIDGLQIKLINTGVNGDGIATRYAPAGKKYISNNIITATLNGSINWADGICTHFQDNASYIYAWNNVIYNWNVGSGQTSGFYANYGYLYAYNNTLYNNIHGFWKGSNPVVVVKNNIVQDSSSSGFYGSNFNPASGYNISDDDSAPGINSKNSTIVSFVDESNDNFHLASSDTAAKDAGTNLSTDFDLPFVGDIDMNLRSGAWDVGADEQGATGSSWPSSIDNSRYFKYKWFFTTNDTDYTPTINNVTIHYTQYATTSELISSPYDTSDASNLFAGFTWTESATSSNETIKLQIRSAATSSDLPNQPWCGPNNCLGTDYFTDYTGDNVVNSTLLNGSNSQWLQYRVTMTSAGGVTPVLSDLTMVYVVNVPPELRNISANQQSDGTVLISYEVRDPDTDIGTETPGYVTPSFEYSLDNGATWTAIVSGLSEGATSTKSVATSSWAAYSLTWNPKNILDGTYSSSTKIRITADDSEGANNTVSSSTAAFIMDVKNPVPGSPPIVVKATSTPALLTLSASDDSSLWMKIGLESDLSDGTWVSYSTASTISLATNPDTVYVLFKDAYSNISATSTVTTPNAPTNMFIKDISNIQVNPDNNRLFVAWGTVDDPPAGFAYYRIYRSTDGSNYSLYQSQSNRAVNYLVDDQSGNYLNSSLTYYYKVAAEDVDGNSSYLSSVVSERPNGQGGTDVTAPTISNVTASGTTTQSIIITWTTDELSNSIVGYSVSPSTNYSAEQKVATYASTTHSVILSNLSPNVAYNYKVMSVDPSGNVASSTGYSFVTYSGPVVSSVSVTNVANNSAKVVWSTNVPASAYVVYATTTPPTGHEAGSANLSLVQSVDLSGLSSGSKYYFYVKSQDADSNWAYNYNDVDGKREYYSFTTTADVSAPTISNVSATSITDTTAVIEWNTDERSTSQIEYGTDNKNYSFISTLKPDYDINHFVTIQNLSADTTYYYRVGSVDQNSNSASSTQHSFTTKEVLSEESEVVARENKAKNSITGGGLLIIDKTDKVAPVISNIRVTDIRSDSATVNWITNEDATSLVEFRVSEQQAANINHVFGNIGWQRTTNIRKDQNGISAAKSHSLISSTISLIKEFEFKKQINKWLFKVANAAGFNFLQGDSESMTRFTKEHSVKLTGLQAKTTYEFRILSQDTWGNIATSSIQTFTTISLFKELEQQNNRATSSIKGNIVSRKPTQNPFDVARQALKKAWSIIKQSSSSVSLSVLESTLLAQQSAINELSDVIPPPKFLNSPKVDIDANIATIEWQTDKKSNSLVAFAPESDYRPGSKMPYRQVVGNSAELTVSHKVVIYDLEPDTVYHYQIRGQSILGSEYKSGDFTFKTLSETIRITNYVIERLSVKKAKFKWFTNMEADSFLAYTPYRNERLAANERQTVSDPTMATTHEVIVDNFERGTTYDIELVSRDTEGNAAIEQIKAFSTAKDDLPPQITQVRTDSAISPGKNAKVQTVISWITNEPSTSRVYYQKGFGKKGELLEEATKLDKNYTKKHVAVITKFDSGAVYQFRVESIDSGGNVALSRVHTVFTPRRRETVFQVIMKNIEEIFGWMGDIR